MSNEQDNKPEITAMQQMIDWIKNPCDDHSLLSKAEEIRDTVEKEQLLTSLQDGYAYARVFHQIPMNAEDWYTQKYVADEK